MTGDERDRLRAQQARVAMREGRFPREHYTRAVPYLPGDGNGEARIVEAEICDW